MGSVGHRNILALIASKSPYAAAGIGSASRAGRNAAAGRAAVAAAAARKMGRVWRGRQVEEMMRELHTLWVGGGIRAPFVARKLKGWTVRDGAEESLYDGAATKKFGTLRAIFHFGGMDEDATGLEVVDTSMPATRFVMVEEEDGTKLFMKELDDYLYVPLRKLRSPRERQVLEALQAAFRRFDWPGRRSERRRMTWNRASVRTTKKVRNAARAGGAGATPSAPRKRPPALLYDAFRPPSQRYVARRHFSPL